MDLVIDYSSPPFFASVAIAFVILFTLFRNYRFRLNTIFFALGFSAMVGNFILYLISQTGGPAPERYGAGPEQIAYFLVFGNLLLFFIFLLLQHLDELPTRKSRVIPLQAAYVPGWINFILGLLIVFLGLSFLAYMLDSSGFLILPTETTELIESSLVTASLAFCTVATLVTVISVFRLIKKLNDEETGPLMKPSLRLRSEPWPRLRPELGGKFFEKIFSFLFGLLWMGFCLIFFQAALGVFSEQSLDSPATSTLLNQLNFGSLLTVFSLGVVLFLGTVVNRRYFVGFKVAFTQFLATLIVMFNLISLLNASTVEEIVLRLILVVVLALLSHLLVRSVASEIQKRKKIQDTAQEILAANKTLSQLDKAKSDFIAAASHQLRSPLSVVKGISSMLLDGSYGKVTGQIKSALEKVFISNERLIGLIESLLDISHLEEGRVDFSFVKIDLNLIAKKAADGLTLQAKNKKLYLKFKPWKRSQLLVWADESKITEAVSNLVDNALKYTRKGGVTVELKKSGSLARVSVRDTGIGLRKEEIGNLFQKFVRTGRGNKLSPVGTGLGLYVVHKMIEAHKGKIYAQSLGEGRGSTFTIELPLDLKTPPNKKFIQRVVMKKQPA